MRGPTWWGEAPAQPMISAASRMATALRVIRLKDSPSRWSEGVSSWRVARLGPTARRAIRPNITAWPETS